MANKSNKTIELPITWEAYEEDPSNGEENMWVTLDRAYPLEEAEAQGVSVPGRDKYKPHWYTGAYRIPFSQWPTQTKDGTPIVYKYDFRGKLDTSSGDYPGRWEKSPNGEYIPTSEGGKLLYNWTKRLHNRYIDPHSSDTLKLDKHIQTRDFSKWDPLKVHLPYYKSSEDYIKEQTEPQYENIETYSEKDFY